MATCQHPDSIPPESRCPSTKDGYACGVPKGHHGSHRAYCCSGPGAWSSDEEINAAVDRFLAHRGWDNVSAVGVNSPYNNKIVVYLVEKEDGWPTVWEDYPVETVVMGRIIMA